MSPTVIDVTTPNGVGRLHADVPDAPRAIALLGGGASGVITSGDLVALASGLPGRGVGVIRFEQPWRVAGKKIGPRAPLSDPNVEAAVDAVAARWPGAPILGGGRSAGARIACRTHRAGQPGVLALSFPLHPPGKPESSRIAELASVAAPVLVVIGARDPFGSPAELDAALAAVPQAGPRQVVVVPGATHSFPARTLPVVVDAVAGFVDAVVG